MDKPIVVAVAEEEESREALRLAVCAARVLERPLVIAGVAVTLDTMPVAPIAGWVAEPIDVDATKEIVARHLRTLSLSVPEDVAFLIDTIVASSVAGGVEALAERHEAEAVVLGASHHGLLTRVLDGDLVLGVLRHAGCPVIVAAQDPADAITATAPKRIGVAWDRGEEAHEALVVAARVAELAGGKVHVVHVIEAAAALVLPPGDPQIGHELAKTRHRECDAAIRAAAHAVNPELEVEIDLRDGRVSKQIEAATKDLDVLIVGSHRKGLLKRVTVGSVSEHLVHHNHCPVVVVPRGVTAGAAV